MQPYPRSVAAATAAAAVITHRALGAATGRSAQLTPGHDYAFEQVGDQAATREQAGDQAAAREQAGDQAATREQAGDQAATRDQAGDQADTREQAGDQAATRDQAGRRVARFSMACTWLCFWRTV
jgi:hypothetical protein